jgi:ligand-binding sensor domain-containing protein/signal transduction histidine kinase
MLARIPKYAILILTLFQGIFTSALPAQTSISRWEAVRSVSGPSPSARIRCLMVDRTGFLWIGLGNGLMRYDGYVFTHYQHNPDDSTSLSADWITCMAEDKNGDIWLGTFNGGVNRYNRKRDDFTRFPANRKDPDAVGDAKIKNFCLDREGRIWVAHGSGLDLAEPDPNSSKPGSDQIKFRHFRNNPDDSLSLPTGEITDVVQDRNGQIWLATFDQGLRRMTTAPGGEASDANFIPIRAIKGDSSSLGGDKIFDLQIGPQGQLVVSHTQGVAFLTSEEAKKEQPVFINHYDNQLDGSKGSVVHKTFVDPLNRLWAVSAFGIHRFDNNRFVESFHPMKMGLRAKGYNVFYDMAIDPSGTVWLAAQEGLFRTPAARQGLQALRMPPEDGPTTVTSVIRDHRDQMWVGLEDNGLLIMDPKNTAYARFRHADADPGSLQGDFVTCVFEDRRGRIWVGTYGGGLHVGVSERDADGKVTAISFRRLYIPGDKNSALPDPYHYDLIEARDSTIWTATFYGAGYYDEAAEKFEGEAVFVANAIHEAPDGQIWVATDKGLYFWQSNPDSLVKYLFPDNAPINLEDRLLSSLASDYLGRLWIGSSLGLVRLGTDGQPGEWLRQADGLGGNSVHGIVSDGKTGFWITIKGGITHFDVEKRNFRNLDHADGLLNERFTNRTIFRDKDGTLYFGGDLGIDYFHPDSLSAGAFDPPMMITGFRLFNRPLSTREDGPDGLRLPKQISLLDSLELRHSHKVFSIDFAALDFRQSASIRYRYQMEGFDRDWQETDPGQHTVTYTNLDPGDYQFRVRAVNSDGQESKREARLFLSISPPWWRSSWAYAFYLVLFIGILTLIFRLRISAIRREMATQNRIAQARIDERDLVRASSSRDFHDEAGNRLTRISLYLGLLRQQASGEADTSPMLDKIEENLQSLSGGMRDFIWVLDPRHDNIPDLLLRLARFGDELFEASEVRFRFENHLPENLDASPDVRTKRHLLLIFKEAMHNAIRHAEATEVVLTAEIREGKLIVQLEDDGKGFAEGELERINGLNNMRERAVEIGGELRVESEMGKGTKWVLEMGVANG